MCALVDYAASAIELPLPPIVDQYKSEIDKGQADLGKLKQQIDGLKAKIADSGSDELYELHKRLVGQYKSLLAKVNSDIDAYNQLDNSVLSVTEIGGGINLEPQKFNIKMVSSSLKLDEFKKTADKAGADWQLMDDSKYWIKSTTHSGGSDYQNFLPKRNWIRSVAGSEDSKFEHLSAGTNQDYWASTTGQADSWRDLLKVDESAYRERMFNKAENVLHVAEYESGTLKNYIIGKRVSENRIVFSRSTRQDLMKPQEPPVWWIKQEKH